MRLIRRGIWLSLAALTSGFVLAVPGNAQALGQAVEPQPGVGNLTGGDVTAPGAAPPMTQQAKDKVAATLAQHRSRREGNEHVFGAVGQPSRGPPGEVDERDSGGERDAGGPCVPHPRGSPGRAAQRVLLRPGKRL